jgi:SAM-dependent methyltransferase
MANAVDAEPPIPDRNAMLGVLEDVACRYPEALRQGQLLDIPRIASHLERVLKPGGTMADLGGGLGLMTPGCAALGMESWLIDDFGDPVNRKFSVHDVGVHRELGVHVVETPVDKWSAGFANESLDAVTCIETVEHWHHSPRPVFEEVFRVLKPGGLFLLSGPNAVHLWNRLKVPFGYTNWATFEDWFDGEEFRGHVREPILDDLKRVVRELGFEQLAAWGCNWELYGAGRLRRRVAKPIDLVLRWFPTLCLDVYVLARKPDFEARVRTP